MVTGKGAPRTVDGMIKDGLAMAASDLHVEPTADGLRLRYRVDGVFSQEKAIPRRQSEGIVNRLKVMARLAVHRNDIPQEGGIRLSANGRGRELDLRVSVIPVIHGEKVVVRFFDLHGDLLGIGELGFDAPVQRGLEDLLAARDGLFLVCGPSGSGKTTTVYALAGELARAKRERVNIVSVEDPVERVISGVNQTQVNPERGLDYAAALRAIMRQDPEIIVVGEVRDTETAQAVLRASFTGHLVISTLHCGRAAEAVRRLVDLGLSPALLSTSLRGVLAQRLVRTYCGECRGKGCAACLDTGFKGRTAFGEYLDCSRGEIRRLVCRGSDPAAIERRARRKGYRVLQEAGRQLVKGKVTAKREFELSQEG